MRRDNYGRKPRARRRHVRLLSIEALEGRRLMADGAVLLRDINSTTLDATPSDFVDVGGRSFFLAEDGIAARDGYHQGTTERELWTTDGTAGGTRLVKDIWPGIEGSNPTHLTAFQGRLYFSADDGTGRRSLWKTDGTEAGTVVVRPFYSIAATAVVGETLYLAANDGAVGQELWKSDGTEDGTVLVKDVRPGSGGSTSELRAAGSTIFFEGDDGATGRELWKSDGTAAGTVLVRDVRPGSTGALLDYSTADIVASVGGAVLFLADDGVTGRDLWRSDGTAAGTFRLQDHAGSDFAALGGAVVYAVGDQLWRTDGTVAGTVMLKDMNAFSSYPDIWNTMTLGSGVLFMNRGELWHTDGTAAGTALVKNLGGGQPTYTTDYEFSAVLNGVAYFPASDGSTGYELWRSDGTAAGTAIVKDVLPGSRSGFGKPQYSREGFVARGGNSVYFRANDGVTGYELWKTDGTTDGTAMVRDVNPVTEDSTPLNPYPKFTAYNGWTYFLADDGTRGTELWRTDGTPAGTALFLDVWPGAGGGLGSGSGAVDRTLVVSGGTLYFEADDGIYGTELWKTDGTPEGTRLVEDIYLGRGGSLGGYSTVGPTMVDLGGTLYFYADGGTGQRGLWKSDGLASNTVLVKAFSSITQIRAIGGALYLTANDESTGHELWRTDGTAAGTVPLGDIRPGVGSSNVTGLTAAGPYVYFTADDGTSGVELWRTDGTAAGTILLKDINPGTAAASVSGMVELNGKLYFGAKDGVNGHDLWVSDGTPAGTQRLVDFFPGSNYSGVSKLTRVGGSLAFVIDNSDARGKLWKSDGTAAGTVLVKDFGSSGYFLYGGSLFTASNGMVFFAASDGTTGVEPWRSDLTAAGTILLKNIGTASSGLGSYSDPSNFIEAGGVVYFTATSPGEGMELWRTDGTPGGTVLVTDIAVGAGSSVPRQFHVAGSKLLFLADDGRTGVEPYAIGAAPPPSISISDATWTEGDSGQASLSFTLTLSRPAEAPVTVQWTTADGSARAGLDYVAASGSRTFQIGESSKTVTIQVLGDVLDELVETFAVYLSAPSGAVLADPTGLGTILDNDPLPVVKVAGKGIAEGNSGSKVARFKVSVGKVSGRDVTVSWATANGTATAGSDYTAASGTVTIPAGQLFVYVDVTILGDSVVEPDETFTINLTNPINATLPAKPFAVGKIVNDEATLTIDDVTVVEGNAGTKEFVFTVRLSRAMTFPVSFKAKTVDVTALGGLDYDILPVTNYTFTANDTNLTRQIRVVIRGDQTFEGNETFRVQLSAGVNAYIADNRGVGTIVNDDI